MDFPRSGGGASGGPLSDGGGGSAETTTDGGHVLVVDDDEAFANTVKLWLEAAWDVTLAHDGDEAVEQYGPHIDVVLLDRRMPTMAGDEALPKIREQEGDACIAMMTAVDPEWDIVEMDFDMYLTKPLDREDLIDAVEELFTWTRYARETRALFKLSSKIGTLEKRYSEEELQGDERYEKLIAERERIQQTAREEMNELSPQELKEFMQLIDDAES
ncbi:response regulator [Halospeciosus flavus]|uniref:Response regulator n=1 Tax=Halospeciosus flavus TaxID=3032283 RepID=A0ABD5Z358_9EURY|nr:response regulator [Halospeciosus flavus]